MARDKRWPIAWTVVLMSIHLIAAIVLLGLAASDLTNLYSVVLTWSFWIVPQCCVVIIATIIHIVCVCSAKLNPGWTLSFYLIMWLAWVALAAITGITYSFWSIIDDNSYYWDSYYGYGYYDYSFLNLLTVPKVMAELALISICGASGLAIWIFCCVIVNRWRRERNILIQRGSQMPIQYVNVHYGGPYPGPYPGQPIDPNNKAPYVTQYTMPPPHGGMVQYPLPTQSPPQNYEQYTPSVQSPVQNQIPYPPPSQSPIPHHSPIQSPAPIRKPIHSIQSDEFPTHYSNIHNS